MEKKQMRIDKVLSHIGLGTRKDIKKMIKQQRVTIGGELVTDPGQYVNPTTDAIEVNKKTIKYREFIYLMLNKPQGVISATEDKDNQVVTDLLEEEDWAFDPFPVGRLDKDTEGFLLLTNDGKLAHQLTSPKKHVPKTYYAIVSGKVTEKDVEAFQEGVTLEDGYKTLPGELKIIKADEESEIELTIYEGKFHQVKRMFEAVGKKVTYLKRLSMGALTLDPNLELGEYRELTEKEVQLLNS